MKVVPDASLKRLPKAGTMILDPSDGSRASLRFRSVNLGIRMRDEEVADR